MKEFFRKFSQKVSTHMGSPQAFAFACGMVILWGLSGPHFHYSDTWELIINTATTIITFLMVFVIQNSQNRDVKSLHLKLDELIRATKEARNRLISLEKMSEEDLDKLEQEFTELDKSDVLVLKEVKVQDEDRSNQD